MKGSHQHADHAKKIHEDMISRVVLVCDSLQGFTVLNPAQSSSSDTAVEFQRPLTVGVGSKLGLNEYAQL